jgi:ribosomal-protein-alanine N-acetyltransferase
MDRQAGTTLPLFVCLKQNGRIVGGVTLGSIRRGVAESCTLGYWMGEQHAGQGPMADALRGLLPHVFDRMRLHRIEAACIPDNARSQRLLEKVGFRREGYLNGYLKINGAWRDHLLYALIAEDWQSIRAKGSGSG